MPARDLYHNAVVHALMAEGWDITHDPLVLSYGGKDLYVDLGAEHSTLAAEKNGQKIAVEIKSFVGASLIHDLEEAVGQYEVYQSILLETDPNRLLYLAVPQRVYEGLFLEQFGQAILARLSLRLIVFDEHRERILTWLP